jgi:hypothetical protein
MPPGFRPDLSNPFQGNVQMMLQNELANLWGSKGGSEAVPVQAPPVRGGGGQTPEQTKFLADLMSLWQTKAANQSPEAIRQNLQSLAEYEDPVRYEQEKQQARQAKDPWGPGGQFEGRRAADLYSPEAILASQGNTAEMQLRQAGAARKPKEGEPEFDLDELKRMNQLYAAGRRSYVG